MPGNTCLACAAPFLIWKITRDARQYMSSMCSTFPYMEDNLRVCFVYLTSAGLQGRACLISDWLSMVLWCDNSGQKGKASIDLHHDSFAARHLCYALMRVSSYAHLATGEKIL